MKKKISIYFLILFLFIFVNFVIAKSSIPGPATGFMSMEPSRAFLGFLIYLFKYPPNFFIILIPFLIGAILPRKTVTIGHFLSLFIGFSIFFPAERGLAIVVGLLFSLFFTVISFIFSDICKYFKNIRELQEVFSRTRLRFIPLLLLYPLFFLSRAYIYWNNIKQALYLYAGFFLLVFLMFFAVYKIAKKLPKRELAYSKKDYIGFFVLFFGFIILFFLFLKIEVDIPFSFPAFPYYRGSILMID